MKLLNWFMISFNFIKEQAGKVVSRNPNIMQSFYSSTFHTVFIKRIDYNSPHIIGTNSVAIKARF